MIRLMIWRKTERCEGLVRYYTEVAKMYYRWSIFFKALIIIYSSSNVIGLIDGLEGPYSTLIHLAVVLLLAFESVFSVEKKYTLCSAIRSRVDKVRTKFHHLWMEYEASENKKSFAEKLKLLDKELDEATELADTYKLVAVERLNKQTAEQAKEAMKGRYEQAE